MTTLRFPHSTRTVGLVLALLALSLFAPSAQAQDNIDQNAVNRAREFLKTENRGRNVLSHLHFGARYGGHTYQQTMGVRNKPGDFALVYRFNWENDGITDLAFLCDSKGFVYQVQVTYTNAFLSQPFALANASISVVGNLFLEAFRDQMTPNEIQQARQMIENPNARGLLEMSLKLQQTFGR